jgi:hypothetical protein
MDRRDFLLLKLRPGTGSLVLGCEELYMRFLDAQLEGSTAELLARLGGELWRTDTVHLTDTAWLADDAFRQALDSVLQAFLARGGRVVDAAKTTPPQAPPRRPR